MRSIPLLYRTQRRAIAAAGGAAVGNAATVAPPSRFCFSFCHGTFCAATPPSATPSAAPAPGAAVVKCLATSPGTPSPSIFREISAGETQDEVRADNSESRNAEMILHCGYRHTEPPAAKSAAASALPSFAVLSASEFEGILADALANVPAEASTTSSSAAGTSSVGKHNASVAATADDEETGVTVVEGQFHNHLTRELQRLIREVDAELAPMQAIKAPIDHFAYKRYYPLLKWACLALLGGQFLVYFNWIFFVFDWNLVEPTTYFIGYTGVFCSLVFHYYRCGAGAGEDFTWRNLFVYLASRKARALYEKKGLDLRRFNNLQATRRMALTELARYKP